MTNFEHKPYIEISDKGYRKGNLLMEFLKAEAPITDYKTYLDRFLKEGAKFNGTNLWLGNVLTKDLVFAHNQEAVGYFETAAAGGSFANGRVGEPWFKQTLGIKLIDEAFATARSIEELKNSLFKAAGCIMKPASEAEWPPLFHLPDEERYENSSIFLRPHDSGGRTCATVSSSVVLVETDGTLRFFERRYDHGKRLDIADASDKVDGIDYTDAAFTEDCYIHKFSV